MYCPKCKAEFQEGYLKCNSCDVNLVEELPLEEKIELNNSDKIKQYLPFLNWKVEKWLKIGGITLIVLSFIAETLQTILKIIPNIDIGTMRSMDNQLLFNSILQLLYSLIKNIMYGVFYIAFGKLLGIMKGKEDETA